MRGVLAVMLGGALGAALRYGVAVWLSDASASFPWHTLAVNLVGSFLIGLVLLFELMPFYFIFVTAFKTKLQIQQIQRV